MASDENIIARASSRRAPASVLGVMLSIIGCVASPALADQVTVPPLKDNTIYGESNDLSNGAGTSLFAGVTAMSAIRRALLAFDVAGTVPAGSTITSAQLVLQVTRSAAGNEPETLHRLLADWGEGTSNANGDEGQGVAATTGDATWRFRFYKSDRWMTPGGYFVAAASATQGVPDSGPVTFGSTAQMVADVQDWLDAPSTNFGWIVVGNEGQRIALDMWESQVPR